MKLTLILAALLMSNDASFAQTVQLVGSDSMVALAQSLVERHGGACEVNGGGTGIGLAALINGTAQIAMSVREPEPSELQALTEKFGGPPAQTVVAYESLAVFVHKANPVEGISLDELRGVYIEGGTLTDWKQLGGAELGAIVRFNRYANSGPYHYFKTQLAGARAEYKTGSTDFGSSQETLSACAKNPASICYASLAWARDGVKALAVAKAKDGKPILPTPATVRDGSYPLGRKLYFITTAKADGATKRFVAFTVGPKGQKVVADEGFVSVKD